MPKRSPDVPRAHAQPLSAPDQALSPPDPALSLPKPPHALELLHSTPELSSKSSTVVTIEELLSVALRKSH